MGSLGMLLSFLGCVTNLKWFCNNIKVPRRSPWVVGLFKVQKLVFLRPLSVQLALQMPESLQAPTSCDSIPYTGGLCCLLSIRIVAGHIYLGTCSFEDLLARRLSKCSQPARGFCFKNLPLSMKSRAAALNSKV